MSYEDFYDIVEYLSEASRGKFTEREIAKMAYTYINEYIGSKHIGQETDLIISLIKQLAEDGSLECLDWIYMIQNGIRN